MSHRFVPLTLRTWDNCRAAGWDVPEHPMFGEGFLPVFDSLEELRKHYSTSAVQELKTADELTP